MKETIWNRFFGMTDYLKNRDILIRYFYREFAPFLSDFHRYINDLGSTIKTQNDGDLAARYLAIFSPLCERFGMFAIKNELDDVCFFILHPKEAKKMTSDLEKFDKKHQHFLDFTQHSLQSLVESAGIQATVIGRKKTLLSLFQKMKRKDVTDVNDVTDLIAFRIVIEDEDQACFRVLNLIHDTFFPVVQRFKDYITIPKINGYQSIHTGVFIEHEGERMLVEIQICTRIMYQKSEEGFSSHFLYKKNNSRTHTVRRDEMLLDAMQENLPQHHSNILAITYTGDVLSLNPGSNVLDFAYRIHSDVGNFAKSATINNKSAPLFSEIAEGDVVHILLARDKQVTRSWLAQTKNPLTLKKIHEAIGR